MEHEKFLSYSSEDFFKYPQFNKSEDHQNDIPISDSRKYFDYTVEILPQSRNYVIGMVDMIKSSKISAQIGLKKSALYYQIFLNSMSKILSRYGGIVLKNAGDCLFFYFDGSDQNKAGPLDCIECGLEMTRSQKYISQQLIREGLPKLDFRVSADYGSVSLMKTNISGGLDMIGQPINMCAKINRLAAKNQMIIGGDLYHIVKEFKIYQFKEIESFSLGFRYTYPVYSVSDKRGYDQSS